MPGFTAPGTALLGQHARGVVSFPFTHLAREGRMTVTIGRRELLAALGSAAAWQRFRRGQDRLKRSLMNSGSHLGARRGHKVLDDHKAVDFSLQVGF
jgi:hypothetical protein